MKYFFPIHLNGGNRGCEAIALGTTLILNRPKEDLLCLCSDISMDKRLGIDKFCSLIPIPKVSLLFRVLLKALITFTHNKKLTKKIVYVHNYSHFLGLAQKDDVMIFTGGDMMCYGNNQLIYINKLAHNKGCKTILWGCSMGKDNLTEEKLDTLHHFSLIYARESLSFEFFKSLGLKNVCLFPDPAFILKPQMCDLPNVFEKGDVIGINLSNFILDINSKDHNFLRLVIELIDFIINKTDYQILLIPHVFWEDQDDRLISNNLFNKYELSNRVSVLKSEYLNYCQIRYVISKCSLFIGARTHSVISAYAMYVPTIAIGYSIKAKGIAKDLELPEELVVDSSNYSNNSLLNSFIFLDENKAYIKLHLQSIMPEYQKRVYQIRSFCDF